MARIGTLEIRVTTEERAAIRAAAKADNRTVSDWVRLTLLRTIIPGEPMKLEAGQVRDATLVVSQIIREARPMSQKGKFLLARMHAKLISEFNVIDKQRDALIQEHGVLVEGETDKWQVPPENMADFTAAWEQVAGETIEVSVTPISIGDLDNIEANELIMLGELVSD